MELGALAGALCASHWEDELQGRAVLLHGDCPPELVAAPGAARVPSAVTELAVRVHRTRERLNVAGLVVEIDRMTAQLRTEGSREWVEFELVLVRVLV